MNTKFFIKNARYKKSLTSREIKYKCGSLTTGNGAENGKIEIPMPGTN